MEDWTILIRNAIAVLVILTAIALVIFFAFMGLDSANRGGEKLSESVGALDARAMETYDQKTISGTTVLAAVKNYKNTSVAIVVVTNSSIRNYNAQIVNLSDVAQFTNSGTPGGNVSQVFQIVAAVAPSTTPTSKASHGLLLNSNLTVTFDEQNINYRNATDSGRSEYINDSAKFHSCIIYNANGEAVGIYMKQTTATTATGNFANHTFLVP